MNSNENLPKSLADLGSADTDITMETTLARVSELRASRSRRRIASAAIATLALVSLGVWMLVPFTNVNIPVTSKDVPVTSKDVPVTSANMPVISEQIPVAATNVPHAAGPRREAPTLPKAPYRNRDSYGAVELRHDVVLRALDFDKAVYEEITTTVGINDDVVMVTNSVDKKTCMQVVCEGGDARTLYCSAPSPSPVMITSPSGRQMMRVEGGILPSSHLVALRTQLHRDSVLVWYEASPAFLSRFHRAAEQSDAVASASVLEQTLHRVDLQRCSPSRMIDGSLRMDITRCRSHERVVSVDMSDLAGHPIPINATYTQGADGKAAILLSSIPAGVAFVRLVSADGTSDTFPVAVP